MYNESDPTVDRKERDEEMERMREHVLKSVSRKQNDNFCLFVDQVISSGVHYSDAHSAYT